MGGRLCLKMSEAEVKVLLGMLDGLLKKKRVKIAELFTNGRFEPSKVISGQSDPLSYDVEQIGFYFNNYTYDELMFWLKKNMD